jgi:uncharacterized protein YecE (DUF72 family)
MSLRDEIEAFDFRHIHPDVYFGTASDRYAGWIGQIYSPAWESQVTSRKRTLGGRRFDERQFPIESVGEYFEHFRVLELDFTFYRVLVEPDGNAGPNWFVLKQYADHAPDHARFYLKAPQQVFARILRDGKGYRDNPDYLNADMFMKGFLDPARAMLGDRLGGVICEQEYQRKAESPPVAEHVAALARFFDEVGSMSEEDPGKDLGCHLEIRSPHLLLPEYFDWLEATGIGHVFSHWTWLPALREQWEMSGHRLTSARQEVVARLLTPLRVPYAKAYATAYPFDRPVPEIATSKGGQDMVLDTVALGMQALKHDSAPIILLNNRAWGSAPDLARQVASRLADELDR